MRNGLIGGMFVLLVASEAALSFDGSVAVGLTFDNRGVRPFADMEGSRAERNQSVYEGSWISGSSGSASGTSGSTGAGGMVSSGSGRGPMRGPAGTGPGAHGPKLR